MIKICEVGLVSESDTPCLMEQIRRIEEERYEKIAGNSVQQEDIETMDKEL